MFRRRSEDDETDAEYQARVDKELIDHLASSGRDLAKVKRLVRQGADINTQIEEETTPLLVAISGGKPEIVEYLLQQGADVMAQPLDISPLWHAREWLKVRGGQHNYKKIFDLVEAAHNEALAEFDDLERRQFEQEERDTRLRAELLDKNCDSAVVEELLAAGANPDVIPKNSMTGLLVALDEQQFDVAQMLLDAGASVHAVDAMGNTPLLYAARHGETDLMRKIIDKGADIDAGNNWFMTALMSAAYRGHGAAAELLLGDGAQIDLADAQRKTAMIHAAERGSQAVAQLLIDKGADLSPCDNEGLNARRHAEKREDHRLATLIAREEKRVFDQCVADATTLQKESAITPPRLKIGKRAP